LAVALLSTPDLHWSTKDESEILFESPHAAIPVMQAAPTRSVDRALSAGFIHGLSEVGARTPPLPSAFVRGR
jgi:hypothetical protein